MVNKTSGANASTIETNDIEPIPANERHGKAWHLFTVWSSPNLEFATIFVGMLGVMYFGLSFWQAALAIAVGNGLGVITHGWLSTWGPKLGVPQMVLSRTAFGRIGNALPSALVVVTAGVGWFAVNSLSGAFALSSMSGIDITIALLIIAAAQIVIALIGHNFIHVFERYAFYVLLVVFAIATIAIFTSANLGAAPMDSDNPVPDFVGFTLTAGAAYGYTAGWTPFASDYTRYLPANTNSRQLGWAAALGMFFSTTILMSVGAAFVTIVTGAVYDEHVNPTSLFADTLSASVGAWFAPIVLLCIAVGSVSANVLNIYSGSLSILAAGVKLGAKTRRAIVALVSGVVGTLVAFSAINDLGHAFEGFLLVVAYWVAPWLGIVVVDRLLRKGQDISGLIAEGSKHENLAGLIALIAGAGFGIWGFANQVLYTGPIAAAYPIGDLAAPVGFFTAAAIYAVLFKALKK
ncbi:MAG: hypothetical protein RIS25_19 [Actinomycetota bacterium]|jgi:NCS1 family nucleobase:cation symporter-1